MNRHIGTMHKQKHQESEWAPSICSDTICLNLGSRGCAQRAFLFWLGLGPQTLPWLSRSLGRCCYITQEEYRYNFGCYTGRIHCLQGSLESGCSERWSDLPRIPQFVANPGPLWWVSWWQLQCSPLTLYLSGEDKCSQGQSEMVQGY